MLNYRLFFLLFLFPCYINAQSKWSIFAKGGSNITNYTKGLLRREIIYKNDISFVYGLGVKYNLNINMSFKLESLIDERGWKMFQTVISSNGNFIESYTDFKYKFLTFPILIQYNFSKQKQFFINGGLNASFKIGGETIINPPNSAIPLSSPLYYQQRPLFDYGLFLGAGSNFNIQKFIPLFLEGRYYRSFSDIDSWITNKHQGLMFVLGIRYVLN